MPFARALEVMTAELGATSEIVCVQGPFIENVDIQQTQGVFELTRLPSCQLGVIQESLGEGSEHSFALPLCPAD